MSTCNSAHPEDASRRCKKDSGVHADHSDGQIWPNEAVQEEMRLRKTQKISSKRAGKTSRSKAMQTLAAAVISARGDFEGAKEGGMEQAMSGSPEEFKKAFLDALYSVAETQETLTSDDVWAVLESKGIDTESRASAGPLMAAAAKQGWTEKTSERRVSSRPMSKSRDGLTVWRSLIEKV